MQGLIDTINANRKPLLLSKSPDRELTDRIQRDQRALVTRIKNLYAYRILDPAYTLECEMRHRYGEREVFGLARALDQTVRVRQGLIDYINANSSRARRDLKKVVNVRAHYVGLQASDATLAALVATALGMSHGIDSPHMNSFKFQLNQLWSNNMYNTLTLDEDTYDKTRATLGVLTDLCAVAMESAAVGASGGSRVGKLNLAVSGLRSIGESAEEDNDVDPTDDIVAETERDVLLDELKKELQELLEANNATAEALRDVEEEEKSEADASKESVSYVYTQPLRLGMPTLNAPANPPYPPRRKHRTAYLQGPWNSDLRHLFKFVPNFFNEVKDEVEKLAGARDEPDLKTAKERFMPLVGAFLDVFSRDRQKFEKMNAEDQSELSVVVRSMGRNINTFNDHTSRWIIESSPILRALPVDLSLGFINVTRAVVAECRWMGMAVQSILGHVAPVAAQSVFDVAAALAKIAAAGTASYLKSARAALPGPTAPPALYPPAVDNCRDYNHSTINSRGLWQSTTDGILVHVFTSSLCRETDMQPVLSCHARYDKKERNLNVVIPKAWNAERARDCRRVLEMVEADFRHKITTGGVRDFCVNIIRDVCSPEGGARKPKYHEMVAIFDRAVQPLVRHVLFGCEELSPHEFASRLDFYGSDLPITGYDSTAKTKLHLSLEMSGGDYF